MQCQRCHKVSDAKATPSVLRLSLTQPLKRRGVQSVCRHIHPLFVREEGGIHIFWRCFLAHFIGKVAERSGQPSLINNKTAMRFVTTDGAIERYPDAVYPLPPSCLSSSFIKWDNIKRQLLLMNA